MAERPNEERDKQDVEQSARDIGSYREKEKGLQHLEYQAFCPVCNLTQFRKPDFTVLKINKHERLHAYTRRNFLELEMKIQHWLYQTIVSVTHTKISQSLTKRKPKSQCDKENVGKMRLRGWKAATQKDYHFLLYSNLFYTILNTASMMSIMLQLAGDTNLETTLITYGKEI